MIEFHGFSVRNGANFPFFIVNETTTKAQMNNFLEELRKKYKEKEFYATFGEKGATLIFPKESLPISQLEELFEKIKKPTKILVGALGSSV